MVSSSPPPCPPSAGVGYSKIGSSSSSSLQYSSDKLSYGVHGDLQRNKLKVFCAGCGGRALACAIATLAICLLVVLLVQGRHSHKNGADLHKPGPSGSPSITPTPPSITPAPSPVLPLVTPPASPPSVPANASSLSFLCNTTEQPQLCLTTLLAYPSKEPTAALQDLTAYVAGAALTLVNQTYVLAENLSLGATGSREEKAALQDCLELLDQARDGLNDSINRLTHLDAHADSTGVKGQVMDVRTWMSSSYTEQDTCWDGFEDAGGPIKEQMLKSSQLIAPLIAVALSFAQTLQDVGLSAYYALHPSPP